MPQKTYLCTIILHRIHEQNRISARRRAAAGFLRRLPRPAAEPVHYTYRVKAVHPHSTSAYTQGLFFAGGLLWEGTGQYGQSVVQRTDLATGRTEVLFRLPRSEFGEGIALVGGELFQLTWQSNTAHVYDPEKRTGLRDHRYAGEGWGLTTDGEKLYMTDGTANLYTIDPATFRRSQLVQRVGVLPQLAGGAGERGGDTALEHFFEQRQDLCAQPHTCEPRVGVVRIAPGDEPERVARGQRGGAPDVQERARPGRI